MKITIIGAGAIGLLLASSLEGDNEVSLLVKKNKSSKFISKGLWIEKANQRKEIKAKIVTEIEDSEIVIIAVKTYDLDSVNKIIKTFKGKIIICQNGLNMLNYKTPNNNDLFTIVTSIGAQTLELGVSKFMGTGYTAIGNLKGKKGNKLETIFSNEYFKITYVPNIEEYIWLKAIINSAINPVAAFHNVNNGQLKNKNYWMIVENILKESANVAEAKGIKIPNNPFQTAEEIIDKTPENKCSMLQDIIRGNNTEINEINGLIVKMAKENNIPTPFNEEYLKKIKSIS